MGSLPSGTVTFLFTDIEGSTTLARLHPETWESTRAHHDEILESAVASNNGYVFQVVGDAFCAAFHKAGEALKAATKAQQDLQTKKWEDVTILVRMGIHTGEAELQEDGQYQGYLAMSLVQRIMSAGHGGQALFSEVTENLLRRQLPQGIELIDKGKHNFKDVPQAVRVFQLAAHDLQRDFPPLRTFDILPHNLPTQLTSFVGREKELADIKRLLQDTHMLTLIGPGGTGKTRLSIQAANDVLDQYPAGVWLVDLAPIRDPLLVPRTTAITIGLRDEPQRPIIDMLCDYLSNKKTLLILDNCEHLVDTCAEMADRILRAASEVRILASSREALGVEGEVIYRVPSLRMPDIEHVPSIDSLSQYEAVKLFIDRATSAIPSFTVTNENASALAQICYRLDGIPLAIELAAAKIRVLSPEQIAKRLDDRFRLLTGGRRTALERHQTLRAAVDWSYNLLPLEEQTLFSRLSVFVGGWTLEAAESVCADESMQGMIGGEDILNLLEQLINKSLVIVEEVRGESRYRMLETMRQYANEKLVESGKSDTLHDRHVDFHLELAETAEPHLRRTEQIEWLARLSTELENLRAALAWSLDFSSVEPGLRLAGALGPYWEVQQYFSEGLHWLESLVRKERNSESREELAAHGKAHLRIVELADSLDDPERMLSSAEKAFLIYEKLNDAYGKALAHALLGLATFRNRSSFAGERPTQARQLLEQSREMFKQLNDPWGQAFALESLTFIYRNLEDINLAEQAYKDMENLSRASGDRYRIAQSLSRIALWHFLKNEMDWTEPLLDEAEHYYEELGIQAFPLTWMIRIFIAYLRGDFEHAKSLLQSTDRTLEIIGNKDQRIGGLIALSVIAMYEEQPEIIVTNVLKSKKLETASTSIAERAFHTMLLGCGYYIKGDYGMALENFKESLERLTKLENKLTDATLWALQCFSYIFSSKEPAAAARLLGATNSLLMSFSAQPLGPYTVRKMTELMRARIEEAEFTEAFAQGEQMSIDGAIEMALQMVQRL